MNSEKTEFLTIGRSQQIFADIIVYIFPHEHGLKYEINAEVERAD